MNSKELLASSESAIIASLKKCGHSPISVYKLPDKKLYVTTTVFGRDVCYAQQYESSKPDYEESKVKSATKLDHQDMPANHVKIFGNSITTSYTSKIKLYTSSTSIYEGELLIPVVNLSALTKNIKKEILDLDSSLSIQSNEAHTKLVESHTRTYKLFLELSKTNDTFINSYKQLCDLHESISDARKAAFEFLNNTDDIDIMPQCGEFLKSQYLEMSAVLASLKDINEQRLSILKSAADKEERVIV